VFISNQELLRQFLLLLRYSELFEFVVVDPQTFVYLNPTLVLNSVEKRLFKVHNIFINKTCNKIRTYSYFYKRANNHLGFKFSKIKIKSIIAAKYIYIA
jgi:uncharacterized Zn-finger protein